ncbi:tryptophan halogenase [Microbulbifer agarilyticus]|uniref:Tryptophan halogenase n=1 Tax=Microbulbifer agarilyticus TaxID=260552 RepID=A0A1Q2M8L3_9GAMM|nr:tryptophan halogenase family protein [Microbulbifer agarilyticus]AQQ68878.1 tryptophan halogenase [Microbulbifer agarilyticus]
MQQAPLSICVLGGGAAGWLTAAVLAAEHGRVAGGDCKITLVESPTIPTIGVGEGTWPSMRETLRRIGLSERRLFTECDAAFKQGSLFSAWKTTDPNDQYYHPFSLPHGYFEQDLAPFAEREYAYAVSPQATVCDDHLAPKQLATPEYAGVLNYGYHFDAVKFGLCLSDHCTRNLGVQHVRASVASVQSDVEGNIIALVTETGESHSADLFVDCSGRAAVLIGEHLQVPWVDRSSVLFNDRALAVQIPHTSDESPIASVTRSTARSNGWIWDIGLPTRRGMGYVYSSQFTDSDIVESDFREFLSTEVTQKALEELSFRELTFQPGHREVMWRGNCVAVGMSAGFIEPLEASALALIEQSAGLIRDFLPVSKAQMKLAATRFNSQMLAHWDHIIEFLKLHYVLSQRTDSEYWLAHRRAESIPELLQENLMLWRHRAPARQDFPQAQSLFPPASYRYVLNGMAYACDRTRAPRKERDEARAKVLLGEVQKQLASYKQGLPGNRKLLNQLVARSQTSGSPEEVGR